jgi:uncharacterized RDD family membrane protein YckC
VFFCRFCDAYTADPLVGKKAGFGRRFGAHLLDVTVVWITFLFVLALSAAVGSAGGRTGGLGAFLATFFWTMLVYAAFSLWFLSQGKTPGKWLLGMRVVKKTDGSVPGLAKMLVREILGKFVSGFFLGIGYFAAIWDRDSQAWHDKIAGTLVVIGVRSPVRQFPSLHPSQLGPQAEPVQSSGQQIPAVVSHPASVAAPPAMMASAAAVPGVQQSPTRAEPSLGLPDVLPTKESAEPSTFGQIVGTAGEHSGRSYRLDRNGLWIGRDPAKCQIVLNGDVASRQHAWIVPLNEGVFIIDRGSTNGTFLNSTDGPRITRERLENGDRIFIGKQGVTIFTYQDH